LKGRVLRGCYETGLSGSNKTVLQTGGAVFILAGRFWTGITRRLFA
jgi:hypothetical protein